MLKTSYLFLSVLLLASCHALNNRHDTLAVQCDINGRTQDKVLVQFTNPGGVELTREQVAQLQVQYQGTGNNQSMTLTSRACVALPIGAARVKAKITGDAPLTADLVIDEMAAKDTIHKVELEAPGVLLMELKCPKNGWLAADALENIVDVKKSLGKLNGYQVDLSLYNSGNEKVLGLYSKEIADENLRLPSSFSIKNVGEGNYKVGLTIVDSYHDKTGSEAKSQCNLTVRRSCAQDEDFDPATVSCVPKLCDNAYRVGAKWAESLALQRGEGRYECRLEKGRAEKVLLSHTCQAGYFKSADFCVAAKEIAGTCAHLETDDVVCWGTLTGKENYPTRKDVNLQTTFKFNEKIKQFGNQCVELQSGKIQCWSIVYGQDHSWSFIEPAATPKTWKESLAMGLVDSGEYCFINDTLGPQCKFRVTQIDGVNAITPTPLPGSNSNCIVDAEGQVWCFKNVLPISQSPESSVAAGPYYRVEKIPYPARQVRAIGQTACAVLVNGHVICWGDNTVGSTGHNSSELYASKPEYVIDSNGNKLMHIKQLASALDINGWRTTFALTEDGRVLAWGTNLEGALANNTPGEDDEGNPLFSRFAVPVIVETVNPVRSKL